MKLLTKIKLINWHGFFNDSITVNGPMLVTGDNGSGKSTLLDAVFFLLTGGDDNKFNAAANENANRTLETYMRGKTGIEGKEYLRNSPNLISHIALEFLDDSNNTNFVIGVVLEIQEGTDKVGRNFYHIKNTPLDDSFYTTEDQEGHLSVLNFQMMKKRIPNDVLNPINGSKKEIRRSIYGILSLENKRYYDLLPKAIAFKPIADVNDFVYQFLMPQKDINISNIRENIHAYNDINNKIKQDLEKKEILEIIKTNGESFNEKSLTTKLLKTLRISKTIDRLGDDINRYERTIKESEAERLTKGEIKENLKHEAEHLSNMIHDIENNEAYRALRDLEAQLRDANNKLDFCKREESNFNKLLLNEDSICEELEMKKRFNRLVKGRDFRTFTVAANQYDKEIKEIRASVEQALSESRFNLSNNKKVFSSLRERKTNLEKGLHAYNVRVEELISLIRNHIASKYHEEIILRPLCEQLEFNQGSDEWRNAIEGVLGDRRFDLIIPHRYFQEALLIYKENRFSEEIDRIGIVDSGEVRESSTPEQREGMEYLSDFLTSDNETSLTYAKMYIGDVICASDENIEMFDHAVSKSCMYKDNDAIYQIDSEIYHTPYIGKEAIRIQLEEVKEKIEAIQKEIENLNAVIRVNENKQDTTKRSRIERILEYPDVWIAVDNALQNKERLQSQYDELKAQSGNIFVNIEKYRAQKKETDSKFTEIENQIQNLVATIRSSNEKKEDAIKTLSERTAELEASLKDNEIKDNYDDFKRENDFLRDYQIGAKIDELGKETARLMRIVVSNMASYITKFSFDATADIDSFNIFCKEYNQVVLRNLASYQHRLEQVRDNAATMFQENYIAEIRRHINDEKRNIGKLNKVLADKPFGYDGEVYQFVVGKSKNKNLADYYDIFTSNENYTVEDLFTDTLSSKNAALMQELFERLTADTRDSDNMKIINQYTDYRSFMSYDIKIKNKRGEESYFSKINKEKSGGETQTPFYVIIAASFDQIINSGHGQRSSGCIIMLDEAFNNMDEAHIDSMMQYFKQLDIQPIIAVPSQRARTIFPYVDTAIALAKIKDRVLTRPFTKAKKDEK